jgi:hypothetical protein
MADYVPQPLGGKASEATLDQANIAMRAMPWYQDFLKSIGQNPASVKLNDQQRDQLLQQARSHGFQIDNKGMQIDEAGNVDKKGHAVRNTLIVAGIAAATIATMGAAGVFAGAAGAGAGAGAASGAGAAGAAAGLGGVEAGALAGLGAAALPGAGTALGAAGALGGTAAAAGGIGAGTMATGGGGILSAAGKLASGGNGAAGYLETAGKITDSLGAISAGRAAGRVDEANLNRGINRDAVENYTARLVGERDKLAAVGTRANNSVRGDIMANAQDAHISMPSTIPKTTISGGLRPSMFSANTRQLGADMSAGALADSRAPSPLLAPPPLAEPSQAGKLDSILNTASSIGSLASMIPYKKKPVVMR